MLNNIDWYLDPNVSGSIGPVFKVMLHHGYGTKNRTVPKCW
jgi:hypothetical protein